MSRAGFETLAEILTMCPLVLPVLELSALLVGPDLGVGIGVDVVGLMADPVRLALAQR